MTVEETVAYEKMWTAQRRRFEHVAQQVMLGLGDSGEEVEAKLLVMGYGSPLTPEMEDLERHLADIFGLQAKFARNANPLGWTLNLRGDRLSAAIGVAAPSSICQFINQTLRR
jgi:hypothetical protein